MELRHLRYFVAVAEEEHITRAATRLGIQQPPLSHQIQNLERELGVSLFVRQPRKVALNAAGKVFLSDARHILASVDEAVQRVRQFDKGMEGVLLIGLTSSASMHALTMKAIDQFRQKYPLVSVRIEEGANNDILNQTEQERFDIAVVRSEVDRYPSLASKCLAYEAMVVAVPESHALAKGAGPLQLGDLRAENFIFFRQTNGSGIGDMLLAACERNSFRPHIVDETRRILAAVTMVAAGFGIAVVPKSLTAFKMDGVVYRDLDPESSFTVPLNVAYRRHSDAQPVTRFLKICESL